MNGIVFGEVVIPPDSLGFLQVRVAGTLRRIWCHPLRLTGSFGTPVEGDFVAIVPGTPQAQLLWLIKRGA